MMFVALQNQMPDEAARLAALDRYDILDTPPEESFDRITRLAKALFGVPVAFIGFLDAHREWMKSKQGLSACEFDRKPTFCNVTIKRNSALIVEDMRLDPLFADNPFVTGEPHARFYAGIPLPAPGGENVGTLCLMDFKPRTFGATETALLEDLARIVLNELELRAVATVDALTGTLMRRAFSAEAERLLALAARHGAPLSCIAFDLDHFKTVNDRFGHGGGDLVLREIASACAKTLRKTDLFGRMGGEEFAILLPHTARPAALGVAEKLRAAIAAQVLTLANGTVLTVTGSFGVAALDRATPDLRCLLDHADQALYVAKNDGRNRCREFAAAVAWNPGPRRRVLKSARIDCDRDAPGMDCTIRSLSDQGAGLDVLATVDVPDAFRLRIDDDAPRPCRVVSRRARHVEVRFG